MAWGTLQIGALALKETDILDDVTNANTGERTIRMEGRETNPGATQAEIEAKQQDIMGLIDRILPVQFERKQSYSGYYRFTDTNTTLEKWAEGPGQVRWSLTMMLLGADNNVDHESRLANVVRLNAHSLAGERWHAPSVGHYGYFVGATVPGSVTRQADGESITVYRAIPAGISPRWGCAVADYGRGRVRFLSQGVERVSPRIPVPLTDWEMNNGLVRVRPATAGTTTILLAFYDGTAWREQAWDLRVAGDSLVPGSHLLSVTVTNLEAEMVSLRLVLRQPSNGARCLVDLLLRRGSRFLEGYIQRTAAGLVGVTPDVLFTSTVQAGYTLSAADANGIKYATGTSKAFTANSNGGVEISSTTALDFWIGAELPTPAAGDDAATLAQQYIGAMAEKVGVVRR